MFTQEDTLVNMIVPKRLFLGPRMCLLMCAIAGGASARDAGCDYAAMAEGCTPPTTATTTSSDCKVYMEYEVHKSPYAMLSITPTPYSRRLLARQYLVLPLLDTPLLKMTGAS